MDDAFKQRGNALENAFYKEKDKQLLEKLRQEMDDKEHKEALSQASGLTNDEALDALVAIEILPETLTTVSLIPLVAVAWADGVMADNERKAILDAAHQSGIEPGSTAYIMVDKWLEKKPGEELLKAWKAYIQALSEQLDPASLNQLKKSIIGRAKDVASAAGGFLGFGAIKTSQQKVLDELSASF